MNIETVTMSIGAGAVALAIAVYYWGRKQLRKLDEFLNMMTDLGD